MCTLELVLFIVTFPALHEEMLLLCMTLHCRVTEKWHTQVYYSISLPHGRLETYVEGICVVLHKHIL